MSPIPVRAMALIAVILVAGAASAADWPQWQGPNRNSISAETGLLKQWPPEGPKLLWVAESLGQGYASVSIARGLIYTTGMRAADNQGELLAHDLDGRFKWKTPYGLEWAGSLPGSRSTPTIDGDRVYVMSGTGTLVCFDAPTGTIRWSIDTVKTFSGRTLGFGFAESVLIEGDTVICTPGGPQATVVALDKMTGQTRWKSEGISDSSAYCSPIAFERNDKRWILTMSSTAIIGIDAANGKVAWRAAHQAETGIHPNSPIYHDGAAYATSAYGTGSELVTVAADGLSASKTWAAKVLDPYHGGVVLLDGYLYGSSSRGDWFCLDWADGQVKWKHDGIGRGTQVYADGAIYAYNEGGTVGLLEVSPSGCKLISKFQVTHGGGEHWAHPVIAAGRLYIRHGDALMAYSIRESKSGDLAP